MKPVATPGPRSTGPRGTERALQSPTPLPVIASPAPSVELLRRASSSSQSRPTATSPGAARTSDEGTTARLPATEPATGSVDAGGLEPTQDATDSGPSRWTFALVLLGATVVLTVLFGLLFSYLRGP